MRHSSFLEVDLNLLSQNFQSIQKLAPKATVLPMVKANAYGNGLLPVSEHLVREHGVRKLGCASLGEAMEIMKEAPDLQTEIMVFSDTDIHHEKYREAYFNFNFTPVIHQPQDLEIFLTVPEFKKVPLVIKMNTGMNRLGFSSKDLEPFVSRLKGRGIDHLMTHFASSYYVSKSADKTHRQMDEYQKIKKNLMDAGVEIRATSVANSGAIEQGIGVDETFVRPGLMMYGPYSVDSSTWKGRQVSRLVTKVLKTFTEKKGTPIGYGVHVLSQDAFIVVLPLGYGDGLMTFTSGVEITVKGHRGKIFGRVNMDMVFVAFDPSVEGKINIEDEVEIWGHDNRVISDIATQAGTHAYQMMCAISGRIPRIYKVK